MPGSAADILTSAMVVLVVLVEALVILSQLDSGYVIAVAVVGVFCWRVLDGVHAGSLDFLYSWQRRQEKREFFSVGRPGRMEL